MGIAPKVAVAVLMIIILRKAPLVSCSIGLFLGFSEFLLWLGPGGLNARQTLADTVGPFTIGIEAKVLIVLRAGMGQLPITLSCEAQKFLGILSVFMVRIP